MKDEIFSIIKKEERRQRTELVLIPSENYASAAVMKAVGSVLMNKYSEGQVGRRYYQGNANIDDVERTCKERALRLFGLDGGEWSVNVQALSGSPANLAVLVALVEPGQRIFSMFLPDGGHLSHGWHLPDRPVSFASKIWDVVFYHVDRKTRVFDYDRIGKDAATVTPRIIISGGTAYPREIDHRRMGEIAKAVGAWYLADIAHEAGLVSAGVNTSPFSYADVVTMTTHKTLRGPRGAMIFSRKDLSAKIDAAVFPGIQGGPHEHTIAGIAVALREASGGTFRKYAAQVVANAKVMAEELSNAGFDVVTGGTDKHLVLVDLRSRKLDGWTGAWGLESAGIIVNRNTVPYDTASSFYPSGIRLGTPAVTTRGMKEREMRRVVSWIQDVLSHVSNLKLPKQPSDRAPFLQMLSKDSFLSRIKREVSTFANRFPVPGIDRPKNL
ncbi:MAG: hypothetical protein A2900_04930 [Candidatus Chisholmbacteria bacterium RIFCSPLOWO2_01_FULL_50_28]|uniref:Serine hydroxymethyltransferase n=1 Tax=Candidatus Chisholmbacteria bacterium RIFCSPHIGHO2_01_FULL_52_32 TaxID=1797591 RepID=A0A1G1VSE0_9BACT|nr:MAG: hypothetical protein A2786_01810 [Candidatus Chisholmbacteria bacterium RIFCSPHIGHO2_01_FULL_52_32]OGY20392.1 MAG: hypothetical protein A2900_04930 [Candidatus Chisholmbacteria bacterium RIFCSPLOWO2_01_FULL_50_28]